jgi:hypothetical protein
VNIRKLVTKSAFTVAVIAANLVIFSTGDAEARRGGGGGRPGSGPPPLASAHTTVQPSRLVSGCSSGRRCATGSANGGVIVTQHGSQGGPGRPMRPVSRR